MHDIDRTTLEYGGELLESPLAEQYEYAGELSEAQNTLLGEVLGESLESGGQESGLWDSHAAPAPFGRSGEMMEDELAAELLEIRTDQELDHFLGKLISSAAGAFRKIAASPIGKSLGAALKGVAKKVLPIAGGALGTMFGGPVGGMLGSKLASAAGNVFGLEEEGLSPEDRDFEVARRFVRFAGHAARRAGAQGGGGDPRVVVRKAIVEAARVHAPGLLVDTAVPTDTPLSSGEPVGQSGSQQVPQSPCSCGGTGTARRVGKWIRRGHHIVLLGV